MQSLLILPVLLGGCQAPTAQGWSGYAEGDFVQVALPLAGTLDTLAVQAGQRVAAGAPLFALDTGAEAAARAEAQARVAAAEAQAANAGKGRRADEQAVTRAQLAQARAQQTLAQAELARQRALIAQGFLSQSRLDDAGAAAAQAEAHVKELEAALRVAQLPARSDERDAARAQAEAAQQALAQAQWREQHKRATSPAAAVVADTYHRVGEFVGAGQPVLSLLPDGAVKARFFVPQAELPSITLGAPVRVQCDGCGAPIAATVSFIAARAEYTPPVIYSNAQKAKLVFMVEARPVPADAARLRPGQPVLVQRASAPAASGAAG